MVQFRAEFFNTFNHTQFNGYFNTYGISGFGGANSAHEHAHPETLRAAIEITKGAQVAVPRTTGVLEVRNDPFAAMSEEELDEYIRSGGIDPATPSLL